jgi:hypothetical protein
VTPAICIWSMLPGQENYSVSCINLEINIRTCRYAPDFHAFLLHCQSTSLFLPDIAHEFFVGFAICCSKHRFVATHVFQIDAVELAVGFSRCPLDLLGLEWFLIGTPMEVSRGTVVCSINPVIVINKIEF